MTAAASRPATPGQFLFRAGAARAGREGGARQALPGQRRGQGDRGAATISRAIRRRRDFIATKLARHFIADDPPPAGGEPLARAFAPATATCRRVYRALIDPPECLGADVAAKFKTPSEYIVSAYRGLSLPEDCVGKAARFLRRCSGERIWRRGRRRAGRTAAPTGTAARAVMKRIEWADASGQKMGAAATRRARAASWLGRA